jgi:plastocyanin
MPPALETSRLNATTKGDLVARLLLVLAGFSVSVALTAGLATLDASASRSASAGARHGTVTIRHETRGCHAWSANGGAYKASITAKLAKGGTITFTDNDVMSHKLVQTSGPAVKFVGKARMSHMSASVTVKFAKAGVYKFTTKPGEDYPGMKIKTVGEDNVLHLTVKVG